jgi:hypothetical protein
MLFCSGEIMCEINRNGFQPNAFACEAATEVDQSGFIMPPGVSVIACHLKICLFLCFITSGSVRLDA